MNEAENNMESIALSPLAKWRYEFSRAFQCYLDRSATHIVNRWLVTLVAAIIYMIRVYYANGYYLISYALGIYILNLVIGFISPKLDPESEALDAASLHTRDPNELRPFIRRLPEFKLWYAMTKAFCISFLMTLFSVFNLPVYWPILFSYWTFLFILTMKKQVTHMIKYRYIPFDFPKQRYAAERTRAYRRD